MDSVVIISERKNHTPRGKSAAINHKEEEIYGFSQITQNTHFAQMGMRCARFRGALQLFSTNLSI
jgi:hypothetical protein